VPRESEAIHLPRGGVYLRTSRGAVQVGVPPETIKDLMSLGLDAPLAYVVPREPFERRRGINVAECEFPAYYNFFLMKRKVRLVIEDARAEERIRAVFEESLFGPKVFYPEWEFAPDFPLDGRPDFLRESEAFRRGPGGKRLEVDTLVDFLRFDNSEVVDLGDGIVIGKDGDAYVVREDGRVVGRASQTIVLPDRLPEAEPSAPFDPPDFGVTILGASHGFDPLGRTTGFVLWIGRRGILVDPPGDATEHLRERGVPPKLIDGVIVTHCHADHDSGTFQKILEESRITVYTTPTILGSFLRKYSMISGIPEPLLRRTFAFNPVKIGEPVRVRGAEIAFFYTLHSIPTIGFEVYYGGKSLVFSADSLWDPERIEEMHRDGVLGDARARDLIAFPWHHTVVLHEAGIPPLHTPAANLEKLPEDVKARLYVVHIAEKDVPPGLRTAKVGLANTIRIPTEPPSHAEAIELLDIFSEVDLFRGFTIARAREILHVARRTKYPKGEQIIAEGTPGDAFYIVASGVASVRKEGDEIKTYQAGDYFGETSLVLRQPRNADVYAATDVELIEVDRYDFLYLLRGTDIPNRLVRLARMREQRSWMVIERNSALKELTSAQKTQLQSCLESRAVTEGEILWTAREPTTAAFIVDDARVLLEGPLGCPDPFGTGAFVGEVDAIRNGEPLKTTARVVAPGRVFWIERDDIVRFFQDNPGLLVSFLGTRFVE
jgi:CRP-like cAMP-binding protein/phosphoribosyl 1,2-cyclic phosphodiesterase